MLTLKASLRAERHARSYGEGRHHFGLGCEPLYPVPRDGSAISYIAEKSDPNDEPDDGFCNPRKIREQQEAEADRAEPEQEPGHHHFGDEGLYDY